jgi:hypothetical protein
MSFTSKTCAGLTRKHYTRRQILASDEHQLICRSTSDEGKSLKTLRHQFGRAITKDSHQELAAQKEKNLRLKNAFGLGDDFIDGSSFSRNREAIEKAEKEMKKNYKMVSSDEVSMS